MGVRTAIWLVIALGWMKWGGPADVISAGQAARERMPDVQTLGPQVGARVPDFALTDQNGQPHTLASVMGPKGAMLVFFRSADW